jgi:8-oxo-dGTP diphosphatase
MMNVHISTYKPEEFDTESFIPQISLDCVVFGFHANHLKVLLLKLAHGGAWGLPGGHVLKEESLEEAAMRVLKDRTGLQGVFLKEFSSFSNPGRVSRKNFPAKSLAESGFSEKSIEWLSRRFITIGFYALVDYSQVNPTPDIFSDEYCWKEIDNVGKLMMDHNVILNRALETLRSQLNYQPIGMNLLPEKFTMPEFLSLYETILAKKMDRRNFKRKIDSYNILVATGERKANCAHKAPFLYRFNVDNYEKALKEGLSGRW